MSNALNSRGDQPGKHEVIFKLTLVLIAFLLTTIVSEFALRIGGMKPGYIHRYGLIPVDQVKVSESPGFIADEEGVFKANLNYKWSKEFKINSDGFRSMEFKYYKTKQKKILFLGDSFTWGDSANPITESFVDIVSRNGYVTFNTGIPGTGPRQYAFLAEKYVPLLKPVIVIIVFTMRNDFDYSLHPMLPYKNLWHITNAGWLYARDGNGNYISAQDAYKQHYAKIYGEKNKFQLFFYKSVIGTYVYVMIAKIKYKLLGDSYQEDIKYNRNFAKGALERIKAVAGRNGAEFKLYIIPVKPKLIKNRRFSVESHYHFFEDFSPFIPDFLTKEDYHRNGHFNNSGHQKYAEFIIKGIKSKTN